MVVCVPSSPSVSGALGGARTSSSPHLPNPRGTSSTTSHSFPFHLTEELPGGSVTERAGSIASSDQLSIYKQRIDAMFDGTRSSLYGHSPRRKGSSSNSVQARIEKMFMEVATSEEENSSSNESKPPPQSFQVYCLGSVALSDKDTTLTNLQPPLKELYFTYRELETNNCKPPPSKLEISSHGLRVVQGNRSELNPFSTIAVWAAVKCVSRSDGQRLAFLPLIADPDGQDKGELFVELVNNEEIRLASGSHSPLLAVVMRQTGVKQLRCHAYVCSCSEDAIVIAANLYQALMTNMKSKQNHPQEPEKIEKPIRPPRRPKSIKTSSETDEDIVAEIETIQQQQQQKLQARRMSVTKTTDPSGDILTKIAIPRSRSFLMKNTARGGNSSLHDLFDEIRSQEGVTNMDDILEKIVNANGMSFNDLKPLYKELLLKLAVTLTRDELYLRSKNIMRRQQKSAKRNRRRHGFKYAFRRSVTKLRTKVANQKSTNNFEFTSILFPARRHRISSSSSCTSYHTLQRRGMRDRARKHKEAVESRLSTIANREIRRNSNNHHVKKTEQQIKRECSSGYVSCSECSLNSCFCDTDSCLDSDKCYCSLQNNTNNVNKNNKKHVVTSTSWRHHLNKPPSTHTSRSLQLLLQQPISIKKRPNSYSSRMDVYEALPNLQTPRFNSVDNLALDYELFRYNSQQNSYASSQQHVLVVSARDNRGRLLYMGADKQNNCQYQEERKVKRDSATEALAVKKSAEIASLFSDMKLSQTTDIRGVGFNVQDEELLLKGEYNTLEPPEHATPPSRMGSYHGSNLENSLGYLP